MHARRLVRLPPGGGPTVVCVHGYVVSGRYFEPTLRALADRAEAWAPDLPGFGRSQKPPDVLDVGQLAEALLGWMDAAGVRAAVGLGNSAGCQTLVEAAVRRPDRFTHLVLNGPTTDPAARSGWRQVLRWARNSVGERPDQLPILLRDYLDAGLGRTLPTFRAFLGHRIEDLLPRVPHPTLVVRGQRDAIVPQGWAEEVTRLLRRGRLETVAGAAHTVNFSRPGPLAELVVGFAGTAARAA